MQNNISVSKCFIKWHISRSESAVFTIRQEGVTSVVVKTVQLDQKFAVLNGFGNNVIFFYNISRTKELARYDLVIKLNCY